MGFIRNLWSHNISVRKEEFNRCRSIPHSVSFGSLTISHLSYSFLGKKRELILIFLYLPVDIFINLSYLFIKSFYYGHSFFDFSITFLFFRWRIQEKILRRKFSFSWGSKKTPYLTKSNSFVKKKLIIEFTLACKASRQNNQPWGWVSLTFYSLFLKSAPAHSKSRKKFSTLLDFISLEMLCIINLKRLFQLVFWK